MSRVSNDDIRLRTARHASAGPLERVPFSLVRKTGDQAVPPTGGWLCWTGVTKTRVGLGSGWQARRAFTIGGSFNTHWIEVRPSA